MHNSKGIIFKANTLLKTSPFFKRTSQLNQSQEWRRWGGHLAAAKYELSHDNEYFAIRTKAALIDISPLYKYIITGEDASQFLDRIVTRDIISCKTGQVMYTPWCDENGKVIEDGTIQCISKNNFRLTSAEPNLDWLINNSNGMNVNISDETNKIAALAIQGPASRTILNSISSKSLDKLKYFWLIKTNINNIPVIISRTGYTGDLGYEIWADSNNAIDIWDIIMDAGNNFGITPVGLNALDIARVEASFILLDVDYKSSRYAPIDNQKSSPYELGLSWAVQLNKQSFIGRDALIHENKESSHWKFRGIEIEWDPLINIYKKMGLPPDIPSVTWRTSTPIYYKNKQVGYATSGCWSPILKRYIALAHIQTKYADIGRFLNFEIKVEHFRKFTPAKVVRMPFFNPARKRSCLN